MNEHFLSTGMFAWMASRILEKKEKKKCVSDSKEILLAILVTLWVSNFSMPSQPSVLYPLQLRSCSHYLPIKRLHSHPKPNLFDNFNWLRNVPNLTPAYTEFSIAKVAKLSSNKVGDNEKKKEVCCKYFC